MNTPANDNTAKPKPTRADIITLLIEAGKGAEEVSFLLTLDGHAGLTPAEVAVHFPPQPIKGADLAAAAKTYSDKGAKLAADKAAEAKAAEALAKKKLAKMTPKELKAEAEALQDPHEGAKEPTLGKKQTPADKLMATVGHKDGKPVPAVSGMITAMMYQMVDVMKILDPEGYKEYRAIKYPGDVESLATEETKKAAYAFAFARMYDKYKV